MGDAVDEIFFVHFSHFGCAHLRGPFPCLFDYHYSLQAAENFSEPDTVIICFDYFFKLSLSYSSASRPLGRNVPQRHIYNNTSYEFLYHVCSTMISVCRMLLTM